MIPAAYIRGKLYRLKALKEMARPYMLDLPEK